MTEDFAARVYPVIFTVLDVMDTIRGGKGDSIRPGDIATRLRKLLGQFDVEGIRKKEYQLAKHALVYWIDEVLVNSKWSHASDWSDHTLERDLFDSRDRAWKFFDRAKAARLLPRTDALETFYLSVCFGFVGVFRDRSAGTSTKQREPNGTSPSPPDTKKNEQDARATLSDPPPMASAIPKESAEPPAADGDSDSVWFATDGSSSTESWGGGSGGSSFFSEDSDVAAVLSQGPAAQHPERSGESSLPATLDDWAASVYEQISQGGLPEFRPSGTPGSLKSARPLAGRAAVKGAATKLGWASLVTAILVIVLIVQLM